MTSAEVLLRCPRRRFGRRNSLWAPPTQWTMRTISDAASSISATTSWTSVRTMRFLRRASVVGASQTVLRFENAERSRISNGCRPRRIMLGDLALDLRRVSERPVPARFKFTRHQPVRGVGGIVLPEGSVGGIARRFEVATEGIAYLILL